MRPCLVYPELRTRDAGAICVVIFEFVVGLRLEGCLPVVGQFEDSSDRAVQGTRTGTVDVSSVSSGVS